MPTPARPRGFKDEPAVSARAYTRATHADDANTTTAPPGDTPTISPAHGVDDDQGRDWDEESVYRLCLALDCSVVCYEDAGHNGLFSPFAAQRKQKE
ncbi:hypothetical protein HPB50_015400 [Hyalomma asiaticum]|uniref:Uncharacterized protein n=1 Tax=Hyalomma asiaticum TaxID=266040 RepID=A0ACB7TL00_HYAAI|nr:hypothetical protein HPB50_015400 [Hyalomma asiaticum]